MDVNIIKGKANVTRGPGDAYSGNLSVVSLSHGYIHGGKYLCYLDAANTTTTPTLELSSGGAKVIIGKGGAALGIGELQALTWYEFVFDSVANAFVSIISSPPGYGVTPAALTKADDTNVTLTLGGGHATALLQATSISVGWSGQLSPARGGSGVANSGTFTWGSNNITFTTSGSTSVTLPTSGTLATVAQVDLKVNKAGDNMTGNLIFPSFYGIYCATSTDVLNIGTNGRTISIGGSLSDPLSLTSINGSNVLLPVLAGVGTRVVVTDFNGLLSSVTTTSLLSGVLLRDGSTTLTANWNAGAYSGTFNSVIVGSSANTIAGGATSGGDLNIVSTTHATLGKVNILPVTIDQAAGRVGINETSPVYQLHMVPTDTSGIGIIMDTGIGTSGLEIYTDDTTGISVSTGMDGGIADGINVTCATAGSYGVLVTSNGLGVSVDAASVAGEFTSRTVAGSFTQDGLLAASTTHSAVNIYRAITLAGFDATAPVVNVNDSTAATGDLFRLVKQTSNKLRVNYLGRTILGAGSTSTAPFQFTSGSLATGGAILAGNVEFLTDKFYGTITTGPTQKEFTMNDASLTSGRVPYVTTNGRLTDTANFIFDGTNLGVGATSASAKVTVTTTALTSAPAMSTGYRVINTSSASSGTQQYSPPFTWSGSGYGTSGAASQTVDMRAYLVPIQGTNAVGQLTIDSSIAGASFINPICFYSSGNMSIGSGGLDSGARIWVYGSNTNTTLTSPGSSQSFILHNGSTTNDSYFTNSFYTTNGSSTFVLMGGLSGVFTSHTAGSESMDYVWTSRNAGSFAERMRMKSNGNLLIGTSTDAGTRLSVQASATDPLVKLYNVGNGSKTSIFFYADTASGGTTNSVAATVKGVYGTDSTTSASLVLGTIYGEGAFLNKNNLYVGRSVDSTTAASDGNLILGLSTPPAAALSDAIYIYAQDSSDGSANSTLCLYTEQAVEAVAPTTVSQGLKIKVNGLEYKMALL